jgi:hypothetical protein
VPKQATAEFQASSSPLQFLLANKHQYNGALDNFYQLPFRHILLLHRRNFLTF